MEKEQAEQSRYVPHVDYRQDAEGVKARFKERNIIVEALVRDIQADLMTCDKSDTDKIQGVLNFLTLAACDMREIRARKISAHPRG